jgi:hypothetical protein
VKKILLIISLLTAFTAVTSAQVRRVAPNKPYLILNSRPGYITINEFTSGFGLSGTTSPYSQYYFGFTTIHGYQVDENFVFGLGTGISYYNDGLLIPLFVDMRYRFSISTITFYVFGDAGFLFSPDDLNNETRIFVNAGPGLRLAINSKLALNVSPGILTQMGPKSRASFLNLRIGATFKPN